jgi:bifunctional DNA-binding transcriptional regulator/antitoxin component of YhaV-PrlF toxin-antitoxin module
MKVDLENVKCIRETAITIRGSRRRVTVPSEVIELFNLKDGDKLKWVVLKNHTIFMTKAK